MARARQGGQTGKVTAVINSKLKEAMKMSLRPLKFLVVRNLRDTDNK